MSLHKFAEQVASQGRGDDSLLVHMTPEEVRNLQKFAEANGTTLTINPVTGLPEAGMLSDLFKTIAPIALGALLGPAGFGLSATMAGVATGGITALATGSLSRGLMAGLGAYGGAGLADSFMNAGASTVENVAGALGVEGAATGVGSQAAMLAAQNAGFGAEGLSSLANSAGVAAGAAPVVPSTSSMLASGAQTAMANPMQFAKDNWKYLAGAASPIAAGMMVPTTTSMPDIQGNDTINQFIYGPNGQYRRLNPVPAKNYGTPAFKPFNEGGIVALAGGGDVVRMSTGTPPGMLVGDKDVFNYFKGLDQSKLGSGALDAQIAKDMQTYNVSAADIARITGTQGLQGDYEKRFVQQAAQPTVTAPTFLAQTADVNLQNQQLATALGSSGLSGAAQYALTHGDVGTSGGLAGLSANINAALASNPKATLADAQKQMTQYDITDADFLRATGKTSGDFFAARDKAAADAAAAAAAAKAKADADAAAAAEAARLKAEADAKAKADAAAAIEAARLKAIEDARLKAIADAAAAAEAARLKAIADGKTAAEAAAAAEKARLEAEAIARAKADKIAADAAAAANKITVDGTYVGTAGDAAVIGTQVGQGKITGVGSETTTGTTGPIIDYGGSSGFTTSPITLAKQQLAEQAAATTAAQNAQLDLYRNWITLNPNATDTDHANFMDKLGLAPDVASRATPLSPQQMKNRYYDAKYNKMTGDSQAAYNFLMGKGANPTKSTVGQIARPYAEATLGYPGSGNQQYTFDPETRSYRLNKDYVAEYQDPTGGTNYLMSPNEIAAYFKANQGQADSVTYDWAVENNLTPQEIASATGVPLSTVAAKWRDAKAKKTAATKTDADKATTDKTSSSYQQISDGLAAGGIAGFAMGGMPMTGYAVGGGLGSLGSYSDGGRLLKGPGDGVSDSIPATIGQKQQPARLADGEFVIPARIVSELGNGSTEAGAKKLYAMMDRVQRARGKTTGKNKVAANSRADKYLPA
jgi:membrane protein involved in colicin uptake